MEMLFAIQAHLILVFISFQEYAAFVNKKSFAPYNWHREGISARLGSLIAVFDGHARRCPVPRRCHDGSSSSRDWAINAVNWLVLIVCRDELDYIPLPVALKLQIFGSLMVTVILPVL